MPVEIQLTSLLLIYAASAALTLSLTLYGLSQLRTKGWDYTVVSFVGIVLSGTIWTVSRLFELVFVSEALSRFWLTIIYIGYGGATMSALFFGLAFAGHKKLLTRRNVALILVLPVLAVFIAGTNQYHELFWTGEFTQHSGWWGDLLIHERAYELPFQLYLIYTVGGALLGLYILMRMAIGSPNVYRQQVLAIILGAGSALFFGVSFGLERQPFVPQFVDLVPIGFALMGLCFAYAIFQYSMLDLVPVARDTVIESMRDGYVVLDTDDRIVDLNNAATEVLGTDNDVVGEPIESALPACASVINSHEHGNRTEDEITVEIDGEQRFLLANVSSLHENDRLIGRLLLLRDVTDRRAVQRRYQALIENSSDLILVVEPDGIITYASPSVENVTGVSPEVLIGRNAYELIHPEDRGEFRAAFDDLVESPGGRFRREYRSPDADGNWLHLEASVWNLLDNPFVEGLVVNAREITDRKEREREIRQKNRQLEQANQQLEQFAGVISHDLRNPINVAKGHLDLAQEGHEESFEKVESSLERMEAIIDDVLELARQGREIGETESVALEDRAMTAWDHVATDEATLVVDESIEFAADPDRLLQLFENLFRNAHEHVGDDVTVHVGGADGMFYVEDDGPGIPTEQRENVFDPGHTTNQDGTGLGLSIVNEIARAHGWETAVTESDSGGARFEFHDIGGHPARMEN